MDKKVRSGQIISPFGIGQIINFPNELSLMVCGLNKWNDQIRIRREAKPDAINELLLEIKEPRLQKLLGVKNFYKPFPYKRNGVNSYLNIPAVRFPRLHYCSNTNCGKTEILGTAERDLKNCSYCNQININNKFMLLPFRFIAACQHGHIQDIPIEKLVHNEENYPYNPDNNGCRMSYHANSGSGDLSSIEIKCTCGAKYNFANIMNVNRGEQGEITDSELGRRGIRCNGEMPWLGSENSVEHCGRHLQVLIRGASNVHYANIISALYLPESLPGSDEEVQRFISLLGMDYIKNRFTQNENNARIILEDRYNGINFQKPFEEVFSELRQIINNNNEDILEGEVNLRFEEYRYILQGRNSENSDFKGIVKDPSNYSKELIDLTKYFESIVLIEKLRETRVFTGFSRVIPDSSNRDVKMKQLTNNQPITWLPAMEVFGEGIFLKFKYTKLEEWEEKIGEKFTRIINNSSIIHHAPTPSYIMIHTFAHILIKRLVYNCGYGSSSLRERLYFSNDDSTKMSGLLIYTSSGDSEGSMGGLVRQGREEFLPKLIKDSIEDAKWCSVDPVCSDIGSKSGQGPNNVNGAACHNCCILPETSCEKFNSMLDRITIVGSLDEPNLGFFM